MCSHQATKAEKEVGRASKPEGVSGDWQGDAIEEYGLNQTLELYGNVQPQDIPISSKVNNGRPNSVAPASQPHPQLSPCHDAPVNIQKLRCHAGAKKRREKSLKEWVY